MNTNPHTSQVVASPVALHRLGQLVHAADTQMSPRLRRRPNLGWNLAPRRTSLA